MLNTGDTVVIRETGATHNIEAVQQTSYGTVYLVNGKWYYAEGLRKPEAARPVYWLSAVPPYDDFGHPIPDEFVDGRVDGLSGWAIMAPATHKARGVGLGKGRGQRFRKQADGRWLKVEG